MQPETKNYNDFADEVKGRAMQTYNYNFSDSEEVNFFIGAFYDGVYLLGMALNETLTEGGDIRDGLAITKKMWSRDFEGLEMKIKYLLRH